MTEVRKESLKDIGKFLKKCRAEAKVTQRSLAETAGLTSAQYISNIERGLVPPSNEILTLYIRNCELNLNTVVDFLSDQNKKVLKAELAEKLST